MSVENEMLEGIISIPIDNLTLAVWNYKTDDAKLLKKLEANIKRHGQVENLIVRELPGKGGDDTIYEVVNGNHRLKALINLGYDNAVCFNLGVISDANAKRIAVETNETKFGTDSIKLAEVMRDIRVEYQDDDIFETMPFTRGEIANFEGMLEFDWGQFDSSGLDGFDPSSVDESKDDTPSAEVSSRVVVKCPHCSGEFEVTS